MPTISWIVFDLGGIVVPESGSRIVADLAGRLGIPVDRLNQAIAVYHDSATKGRLSLLQLYEGVVRDLRLTAEPQALLDRHLAIYKEFSARLNQNVLTLIKRLRKDYGVACLTNTEREIAELSKTTGVFECFDRCYVSTELGFRKPEAAAYRLVLDDLACPPGQILFVDDRVENVQGARAVGLYAVQFVTLPQLEADLVEFRPI